MVVMVGEMSADVVKEGHMHGPGVVVVEVEVAPASDSFSVTPDCEALDDFCVSVTDRSC